MLIRYIKSLHAKFYFVHYVNLIGDSEQSNTHTFGIQMVIVINAYVNRVDAVCKDKVNAFIQDCLCKTKKGRAVCDYPGEATVCNSIKYLPC